MICVMDEPFIGAKHRVSRADGARGSTCTVGTGIHEFTRTALVEPGHSS